MAKRSPPIPFETGSIKPSVAFAAMAASTALPPRFKMSIPTCVAAGTLVQTIPCRARTSERVERFFPAIRSIWAGERLAKQNAIKRAATKRNGLCIALRLPPCVIPSEARNLTFGACAHALQMNPQVACVRSLGPSRTGIVCATRDDTAARNDGTYNLDRQSGRNFAIKVQGF